MPRKSKQAILLEEQVILAKERTILSFKRTGLTFIGAGIVVISVFKEFSFQAIGYIIILIGFLEVFESFRRLRIKEKEMDKLKKKIK